MRTLRVMVFLAAATAATMAGAQSGSREYQGVQRRFTSSEVLSILGKPHAPPDHPTVWFDEEIGAELQTSTECGKLAVDFNVSKVAKRATATSKKMADDFKSNIGAAVEAMPMMIICYMSPSLCAEIKNVNFQIHEHLKEMTDVCRSMDNYIDSQAEAGKEAKAQGWKACVQEKRDSGLDKQEAQDSCNQTDSPWLYTDIAKANTVDRIKRGKQRVLQGMMEAAQQLNDSMGPSRYQFLAAVLGEVELEENGKVLPIFAGNKPLTATQVAEKIDKLAIPLFCDQAKLATAVKGVGTGPLTSTSGDLEERYYEQLLYDTVKRRIAPSDVQDLAALGDSERQAACNALARSVGREVLRLTAVEGQAAATKAFQNQAVPKAVLEKFEARARDAFHTMQQQAIADPAKSTSEVRGDIMRMAQIRRQLAAEQASLIGEGEIETRGEMSHTPCDSPYTCK